MTKQKRNGFKRAATVLATAGALAFTVLTPAVPAHANGFNPEKIIEDALFYDGNALTAAEVQHFLDSRVAVPTARSLRNWKQRTKGRLPDAYCAGGYLGAESESAAEIIAKVGKSCGISQKVLLVMLQKEQSLVTTPSPSNYAYERAMGYGCPDTGPGFTANCDAHYFGFQNQVWNAARQLKRYRDSGDFGWYKLNEVSRIQYHPNPACGTQEVRIRNHATAALYYYTPYVPNAAVLAGGRDNCSAFGNLNFHQLYNAWFGKAVNVGVDPSFVALYNTNPGHYGQPVSGAVTVRGNVTQQRFAHATLYAVPGQQVSSVRGAIRGYYDVNGGADGRFGVPSGHEYTVHGQVRQNFSAATAVWTPQTGAAFLMNGFEAAYLDTRNKLPEQLGAPYGVEQRVAEGAQQRAQRGDLFWSPLTGVTWTKHGFAGEHRRLGGAAGVLGFPLEAETQLANYTKQSFENGTAYYTPRTGAYAVAGDIHDMYQYLGGPNSDLGLPVGVETQVRGGTKQEFEHGTAYRSAAGTVGVVKHGLRAHYHRLGGADSRLGLPFGAEMPDGDRVVQHFEHGNLYWSARGTVALYGAFHGAVMADEAAAVQRFGYPVAPEQQIAGGWRQEFQHATAYWSAGSGVGFVKGAFRHDYNLLGGTSSWLGYPVGGEVQDGAGYRQDYQHGTAYWTPQRGVLYVKGAIRGAHLENGAQQGAFGWPVAAEVAEHGGWSQEFERGTVTWTPGLGIGFVRDDFRDFYLAAGGSGGWLGYPQGAQVRSVAGFRQEFRNASLFRNAAGEILFVKGAIRGAFLRSGAEAGEFGQPLTSEQYLGNDTYRQEFAKVTVSWTPQTGVVVQPKQ